MSQDPGKVLPGSSRVENGGKPELRTPIRTAWNKSPAPQIYQTAPTAKYDRKHQHLATIRFPATCRLPRRQDSPGMVNQRKKGPRRANEHSRVAVQTLLPLPHCNCACPEPSSGKTRLAGIEMGRPGRRKNWGRLFMWPMFLSMRGRKGRFSSSANGETGHVRGIPYCQRRGAEP